MEPLAICCQELLSFSKDRNHFEADRTCFANIHLNDPPNYVNVELVSIHWLREKCKRNFGDFIKDITEIQKYFIISELAVGPQDQSVMSPTSFTDTGF